MNKNEIIEIVDLFSKTNINRLDIKKGEFSIKMEKETLIKTGEKVKEIQIEEMEEEKAYEIKSPLVGVCYEAPSPESEAFVQVGDRVEKGDTVCIVEAMKMINEINSTVSGTVKKIYFKNEELVEYGDVLMEIEEDV